jgi:stearoyl-CoA desaturase (delta-9 desaturase)
MIGNQNRMNELLEKQTIAEEPRTVGRKTDSAEESATPAGERATIEAVAEVTYSKVERLEQRVALLMVTVPLIGMVAATATLWGRGVGTLEIVLMAIMYGLTVAGIGVGYHRLYSHRAFEAHRTVRAVLAVLGSMAGQGPVLFWVALHRRHHKHSDRPGDPHSPHLEGTGIRAWVKGFWHSHVGWMLVPQARNWWRNVPDLLRDPLLTRINRTYFLWLGLGLLIPAAIEGVWTHSWGGALRGLLWGGLVRLFLVHHVTWSINSICHLFGRRPFPSRDLSTNNVWLSLLSFGEAWHNNHHAFPNSAKHGLDWWQIDVNAVIITTLKRLGLVWNVKIPAAPLIAEKRSAQKLALAGGDPRGESATRTDGGDLA